MVLPCFGDLKTSRLCSPRWFLNIHAVWSHSAQRIHCQEYHGQILGTFLESTCASTYTTAMAQWQFKYSRTSLYTQLPLRKIKHSYTQPFINSSAPIKNNRHQLYTHLPPLHQMQSQKKRKKITAIRVYCCWCAGVISQQQNGAAESPSCEPGSVSEWATDSSSPGSQRSGSSHPPTPSSSLFFFSTLLGLSFSLTLSTPFLPLSHSALFPFNQIQAKTRRAIYRRVVLFYQPVSICGTQMYRGLPGCWRQQCSAAANWRLCETERQKERHQMTMWDKRRIEQSWRMHDI